MKTWKKSIALLLAAVLLLGVMPMAVSAYSIDGDFKGEFRIYDGSKFVSPVTFYVPCGEHTLTGSYEWDAAQNAWILVLTQDGTRIPYTDSKYYDTYYSSYYSRKANSAYYASTVLKAWAKITDRDMSKVTWSYTSPKTGNGTANVYANGSASAVSSQTKLRAAIQYLDEQDSVAGTAVYQSAAYGTVKLTEKSDVVKTNVPAGYALIAGQSVSVTTTKDATTPDPIVFHVVKDAEKEFTVIYTDGVEGEELFADQSHTVKEGAATPAFEGTPARTGYQFTGWSPEVSETVTGDVTYTAQWEAKTYTVSATLFFNGLKKNPNLIKVNGKNVTKNITGAYGTEIDFTELTGWAQEKIGTIITDLGTPSGYVFKIANPGTSQIIADEQTVLYGDSWFKNNSKDGTMHYVWLSIEPYYTVKFVSGSEELSSEDVQYGKKAAAPDDPEMEGYVFAGWFDEAGRAFDPDAEVKSAAVYTAKWKLQPIRVMIYVNDELAADQTFEAPDGAVKGDVLNYNTLLQEVLTANVFTQGKGLVSLSTEGLNANNNAAFGECSTITVSITAN